jgi:hypothetical protein
MVATTIPIGHIFGRELPTLEDIFGRELPTLEDIFEFLGGNQSGPRYHGRSGALITEGSGAGRPQRYSYDPVISGSQAYYGPNHSLPTTTPEMLQQWLGQRPEQPEQPQEDRGIASILASMQAPVFGREAMDVSEYYEMTPEERRLLEFYGSGAQSLESRIDTESDRLSAQANILSNVADCW